MRIPVYMLCLSLVALCACAPAFTGVSGVSLTRNSYPDAAITANAPLRLLGYGRRSVILQSDIMTLQPTGLFDYAVYSDSTEGPLAVSAHSIILRPVNERRWRFVLESRKAPNSFFLRGAEIGGMAWTEQLMAVSSEGDWFSDMWRASGREVPERWLARRLSATPADFVRLVAEYRESWPACLPAEIPWLELVPHAGECLEPFLARAEAAFSVQRVPPARLTPPAAPSVLVSPPSSPDAAKLAGKVEARDEHFRGFRRF